MNWAIPLVKPVLPALEEIEGDIREILGTGRITNFGPFNDRLERGAALRLGVDYVASVSCATTGLTLLLNTLPLGSEVVLPSFTFPATAQAVLWNRLTPIFADIDPWTLNLDAEAVRECISPRTSAILAVHAFGVPCAIRELTELAAEFNLRLFFDSAHAFGSQYDGVAVGGFGDGEVFSLSATKTVPCGEGGLVTTRQKVIHDSILNRRNYGLTRGSRDCANMGLNGKINEFETILALWAIRRLEESLARRNQIAKQYLSELGGTPGLSFQRVPAGHVSTYKDFVVQIDPEEFGMNRDELQVKLADRSIETIPYFWPAIHRMSLFRNSPRRGEKLRQTELASDRSLSLPLYDAITDSDQMFVIDSIRQIHRICGRRSISGQGIGPHALVARV